MQEQISYIKEQIKYKRHILITGTRGSGKTTLLNEIIRTTDLGIDIPGITTWSEPGVAVYMREVGTNDCVTIGIFNPESTSKDNRMKPVETNFNEYGVMLLEKMIDSKSEWVSIDEIGYLESTADAYIKKLKQLFEKKRVLAVVRKQDTELINDILGQKNALVIDMDGGVSNEKFRVIQEA